MDALHPGAPYLAGAALVVLARPPWRGAVVGLAPVLALAALAALPDGSHAGAGVAGHALEPLRVDALSRLFGLVFCLLGVLGAIYGLPERAALPHAAAFAYTASALGVVFAGDLLTLFAAWELMAVSSTLLVVGRGTGRARAAGLRYLLVHAAGGAALLAGIVIHVRAGGSLGVGPLAGTPGAGLILLGVAVNAAIPPLHAWLTDAYPEATVGGAVFLSALTTKSAVYVLLRAFPGEDLLVWAGATMALYGVVFAVLENDIRRLLAYHIVSQVGYMVCGVGLGTPLALAGAAAHAFCHILYKGLLFMGAGAVLYATGRSRLTELGGIGRRMPWTLACYTVGALSISGVPLFNGFVSKSLVVAAAEAAQRPAVEWLLVLASVGTFLHTGLKLPWFTFLGPDRGVPATDPPWSMRAAMLGAAALCVLTGVAPGLLYAWLPGPVDYLPYTRAHVLTTVQLLAGTALGFFWLLDRLAGTPTVTLDTDWFYRRGGAALLAAARATGQGTAPAAVLGWALRALPRQRPGAAALGGRTGGWVAAVLLVLAALVLLLA
jgi:multicomponent Na+:H+ antiporter subunit D